MPLTVAPRRLELEEARLQSGVYGRVLRLLAVIDQGGVGENSSPSDNNLSFLYTSGGCLLNYDLFDSLSRVYQELTTIIYPFFGYT